jgi:hypothetical protein
MSEKIDFTHFRDGIGGRMCQRLGLDISGCMHWLDYTRTAVAYNTETDGSLLAAARRLHSVASQGELALIEAILMAADFGWQADDLAAGAAWQNAAATHSERLLAVIACLMRRDA